MNTANVLVNISPTCANGGIMLDELYHKSTPQVNHLQIFGSLYYLHVLKDPRSKLQNKTKRCFPIGYDMNNKAY